MSTDRPDFLEQGERARLFPVLSDSSKEGRATSIFLACLCNVDEYAALLLGSVGRRIGPNAKVRSFTEVCCKVAADEMKGRPDGLIEVRVGKNNWYALVEAKIGNAELDQKQVETYLEIARANKIDAVITISNQFAATPTDHPAPVAARRYQNIDQFHWSWMHLLAQADILVRNNGVADADQRVILNELRRFLSHPSTGVKSFDRMPPAWPELVKNVATGRKISATSKDLEDIVHAWHQEVRDMSLKLSRQIGVPVDLKLPAAQQDPKVRLKEDCAKMAADSVLEAVLSVPQAAAPMIISVNVGARNMSVGMTLKATEERSTTRGRVNWFVNQLGKDAHDDLVLRLRWPRRQGHFQCTLNDIRQNPDLVNAMHDGLPPSKFEVLMFEQPGARFSQVTNFIHDLETLVSSFYQNVGVRLKAWQPSAPPVQKGRASPSDVTPQAISEEANEDVDRIGKEGDVKSVQSTIKGWIRR
jgi:hypothetical protein